MDPLTQGTLGAALPQSVARPERMGLAMLCGFAAGMAPDLDVLIRSSDDPLLFLEYHRQFTHSLIFIPLGAALVAAALWGAFGRRRGWDWREIYVFCLLGYATHALLDACTTYGTQLLWPFSNTRFAWNSVSIIDPLFTGPLLLLVLLSRRRRSVWPARLGMVWVFAYLVLGLLARDMAANAGEHLAESRGHGPVALSAKPSFGNLLLWKTIYRHDGRFFVDAVRLGAEPVVYVGRSIPALDVSRDLPWLSPDSVQARDVKRFSWFSMGYVALDPANPQRVIDIRYSLLPNEIKPLWGIELDPALQNERHVRYTVSRQRDAESTARFWEMLKGEPLG